MEKQTVVIIMNILGANTALSRKTGAERIEEGQTYRIGETNIMM